MMNFALSLKKHKFLNLAIIFFLFSLLTKRESLAQNSSSLKSVQAMENRMNQSAMLYNQGQYQQGYSILKSCETEVFLQKNVLLQKRFLLLRGATLVNLGQPNMGLIDFNRLYQMGERSPDFFANRANAYFILENKQAAIADYQEALRQKYISPTYIHNQLAKAYFVLKRYDEALLSATKVIDLGMKNTETYLQRGVAFYYLGKYKEAIADFSKGLEKDPNNIGLLSNRINANTYENRWKEVVSDIGKLYELTKIPEYLLSRSGVYLQMQQYFQARIDLDNYILAFSGADSPKMDVLAYCLRAGANFFLGPASFRQSFEDCERCLQQNNVTNTVPIYDPIQYDYSRLIIENKQVYGYLAEMYAFAQDSLKAIEHYRHVQKLQANSSEDVEIQEIVTKLTPQPRLNLTEFPQHFQLYPRNNQDSANVRLSGTLYLSGYDSLYVIVLKNGRLYERIAQRLKSSSNSEKYAASFDILASIHAELSEYTFQLGVKSALRDTILERRESIVCGDVYAMNGQSNAIGGGGMGTVNKFCRTINNAYLQAWGISTAKYNAGQYVVGGVGMALQDKLVNTLGVPILLINGAQGGTRIEQHLPNKANREDFHTLYGSLLTSARLGKVCESVKAMIWYQGEWNSDVNYAENFKVLYDAWHQDFPNLKKIYVFQIYPHGVGERHGALREIQRNFSKVFPDIRTLSTVGSPGWGGGHYTANGYTHLGNILFYHVLRDFYPSNFAQQSDTSEIDSPNLLRAYWKNKEHSSIILEFSPLGGEILVGKPMSVANRLWTVADAINLDGQFGLVQTVQAQGSIVECVLKSVSSAKTIGYVPEQRYPFGVLEVYQGPWLLNKRGLGALTFWNVPIQSQ